MKFETSVRRKKLDYAVTLKSVHYFGLCCKIISQCTVQKSQYVIHSSKFDSLSLSVVCLAACFGF